MNYPDNCPRRGKQLDAAPEDTETCPAGTLAALDAARAEVERLNGVLEAAKHVKAAAESVFHAARDRRLAIPADWKSMKRLRNAVKQLNAELGKGKE